MLYVETIRDIYPSYHSSKKLSGQTLLFSAGQKKKKKFLKSRKRKKNFHPQNVLELKRYINKCLICHKKKLFWYAVKEISVWNLWWVAK